MKLTIKNVTFAATALLVLLIADNASAVYDPVLGRFLTRDPIQEGGGINLYQFVGNNPVSHIDPFGLAQDMGGGMTARVNSQGHVVIVTGGMDMNYAEQALFNFESTGNSAYIGVIPWNPLLSLGMLQAGLDYPQASSFYLGMLGMAGKYHDDIPGLPAGMSISPTLSDSCPSASVSRWGSPDLQPGDWVMKGNATPWNYFWSGKYQPAWMYGDNIPAPFSSSQTFWVPPDSLQTPPGLFGPAKAALGQRVLVQREMDFSSSRLSI
jgi:RHS repeat-associated protein